MDQIFFPEYLLVSGSVASGYFVGFLGSVGPLVLSFLQEGFDAGSPVSMPLMTIFETQMLLALQQ